MVTAAETSSSFAAPEQSRVSGMEIRVPSWTKSFFMLSFPDVRGTPYATAASCSPLHARTTAANLLFPSGFFSEYSESGQQKLSFTLHTTASPASRSGPLPPTQTMLRTISVEGIERHVVGADVAV